MIHDDDVCGALPMSSLSLWVGACHAHQAVVIRASGTTQEGEAITEWWGPADVEMGPFDGLADLSEALDVLAGKLGARLPELLRRVRS